MASIFVATGQDVANVVESASAQLHISAVSKEELDEAQKKLLHSSNGKVLNGGKAGEGGVYFSMQLPSVIAATVGGGTTLATQKECLQIMGCHGKVTISNFICQCNYFFYILGGREETCRDYSRLCIGFRYFNISFNCQWSFCISS